MKASQAGWLGTAKPRRERCTGATGTTSWIFCAGPSSRASRMMTFGAMFDVFDEVVRKAKKELNSVKLPALRTVVSLFSDIHEANYTGAAKRQRLVEEMRNRLHSDVRIDANDI